MPSGGAFKQPQVLDSAAGHGSGILGALAAGRKDCLALVSGSLLRGRLCARSHCLCHQGSAACGDRGPGQVRPPLHVLPEGLSISHQCACGRPEADRRGLHALRGVRRRLPEQVPQDRRKPEGQVQGRKVPACGARGGPCSARRGDRQQVRASYHQRDFRSRGRDGAQDHEGRRPQVGEVLRLLHGLQGEDGEGTGRTRGEDLCGHAQRGAQLRP